MSKKAQIMGLPFQMIFSIILIAIFLYVGFTAIKAVMSTSDTMKLSNFVSSFRNDLEKTMATTESTQGYKYGLPSSIKMVCFSQNIAGMNTASLITVNSRTYNISEFDNYKARNLEGSYVIFYPRSAIDRLQTAYYAKTNCQRPCLNLSNSNNPKCFEAIDGVVSITLCKTIGDPYARFDCVAQMFAPPITPPVAQPNCTDGIKNQDETGIDCGGLICPICCGNNRIDYLDGEVCDGTRFGGQTCLSIKGTGWAGPLVCSADCESIDDSGCYIIQQSCTPSWTLWSACQDISGVGWAQQRDNGCSITETRGTSANPVANGVDSCIRPSGCMCANTETGAYGGSGGCIDGFDNNGINGPDSVDDNC